MAAQVLVLSCGLAWEPMAARATPRVVVLHDHHAESIPYGRALGWQRTLHAERAAQLRRAIDPPLAEPPLDDALILLQHPPTYTLGARSDVGNVLGGSPEFELVRTERGGEVRGHSITAHTSGQPAASPPSEGMDRRSRTGPNIALSVDSAYGLALGTARPSMRSLRVALPLSGACGSQPPSRHAPPPSHPPFPPLRAGDVPRARAARHLPTA